MWGLGSYFACLAYDRLTGSEDSPVVVKRRAQQLRETLTELGPSFIKAGQVLANRPDIVREDYMNELCILQVREIGGGRGRVVGGVGAEHVAKGEAHLCHTHVECFIRGVHDISLVTQSLLIVPLYESVCAGLIVAAG